MSEMPLLEVRNLTKMFGSVIALNGVSLRLEAGEVMCLLGDNGAGKSTLIKTLSGVHKATDGEYYFEGHLVDFNSPREALELGIATVYQDLAMIPLLSIARNFFLGSEPTVGWGPFKRFDMRFASRVAREEMSKMSIDIRDPGQSVGTLSGGERQSVAIARAVYYGAKVLILDEPTSALGVAQSGIVLRYMAKARSQGIGVIFITHNPHHAYPIGDRFTILKRGRTLGTFAKEEISQEEMIAMMSGADELQELSQELEEFARTDAADADKLKQLSQREEDVAEELETPGRIASDKIKRDKDSGG